MSRPRPGSPRPGAPRVAAAPVPPPRADAAIPPAATRRVVALLEGVRDAHAAKRYAETIGPLREAAALAPRHYDIRTMLATAYLHTQQLREALGEFNRIAQDFPGRTEAWNNLAGVLSSLGHFPQALKAVARSLECDPTNHQAMLNLAEITKSVGDWGSARDAYVAARALAPDDMKLRMQHGLTLVTMGDWLGGWPLAEARDQVPGMKVHAEEIPSPRWDGQAPLDGRTVLLTHEQGLGDSIMCVRFARDLAARGARVLLRAPKALVRLLSQVPWVDEVSELHSPLPPHDLHVPIMSLPALLGLTVEGLDGAPYLAPVGSCPPAIAEALPRDGTPTVALAWAGNPIHVNDKRRSIAGALLAPILAIPGVRFVAIQKVPPVADCLPAELQPRLLDAAPLCGDFADTTHLLARCDLLVSVDSAVAHLAGAQGVPVATCLPFIPDYRWLLGRTDSPWYRSMTLLRQRAMFEWGPVLADVEAMVRRVAASRPARAVA